MRKTLIGLLLITLVVGALPAESLGKMAASQYRGSIAYDRAHPEKLWYINRANGTRVSIPRTRDAQFLIKKLGITLRRGEQPFATLRRIARAIATDVLASIPRTTTFTRFTSVKEFDTYVEKLATAQKERQQKSGMQKSSGISSGLSGMTGNAFGNVVQESALSTPSTEKNTADSITNNQELGVDEGDIVKAYKGYLVVLRRGRLFTIKLEDQGKPVLTPVARINAYPDGLSAQGWYDEMLLHGNRIIVVGYNYSKGATEIELIAIDDAGALTHAATYFLDSNDYYSSRNYASRLVDGKLVFYMPYYLFRYGWYGGAEKREVKLPAMRKWMSGDKTEEQSILQKVDIYKPIQEDLTPALHTVVICDLAGDLACSAKGVLGPASRNFYVSPNAVYLWITESTPWHTVMIEESDMKCLGGPAGTKCGDVRPKPHEPNAYAYRLDLRDGSATVLRADGGPIDQFSFKEADGFLNVLVRAEGRGEAMWRSEVSQGALSLLRVPITAFTAEPTLVAKDAFTSLPTPEGSGFQNRFVGDSVLYGGGGQWWWQAMGVETSTLYRKRFATTDPIQTVSVPHAIDRIEVMGDGAVVIGAAENALKFSSITLGDTPTRADTYALEKAAQGELRSHGFFYSPHTDGTGVLGLPIRKEHDPVASYIRDSASVLYLTVSAEKKFASLGTLDGKSSDRDDQCVASCVDWYGNARPIFYRGRTFALLGYELVEGAIADQKITEIQRADYLGELPAKDRTLPKNPFYPID
ncbi:beta-propeller domain-containing protein [Candidatus Uhrbacteria bacterium]|nr:beta-propeller domain-containing protein [Candidatus Uhrbacteria bacterium]